MTRRPIPTGEAHESDFGAFLAAVANTASDADKRRQEQLAEQQREALQRAHEAAQVRRFAA
jgi:hypothetical protein